MKFIERKPIPDYPGYYADGSGRIWRRLYNRWLIIKPVTHHDGYQYTHVGDDNKQKLTQRLVCSAFKGEHPSKLPICIRKARRQQARRVRSQRYLEWGSCKDVVRKRGYRCLTREQQLQILKLHQSGKTQIFLANQFGVTQSAISFLVNGKTQLRKE